MVEPIAVCVLPKQTPDMVPGSTVARVAVGTARCRRRGRVLGLSWAWADAGESEGGIVF